jgi:formylglycine-generating enzyme required for sulfatase activity
MVRIAVTLLLLMLLPLVAHAEKRVALVIGNGAYMKVPPLRNPTSDANAIANLLRKNGWFDTVEIKADLGVNAMRKALRDFSEDVRDADIAVVFYAGHGIEVSGTNYLIPTDAVLERDVDLEDEGISLDRVIRTVERARRLQLIILDACRDNPFVRTMRRTVANRSIRSGHGDIDERMLPANSLIAYAQRTGGTADDGLGDNSPYTAALLKHVFTPGLDVELALRRVRDEVLNATRNRQEPFKYGSLGGPEIPLVPAAPQVASVAKHLSEAAEAWEAVKETTNIAALELFVTRFKNTYFSDLARLRIEALKKQQVDTGAGRPEPGASAKSAEPALATDPPSSKCTGVEAAIANELRCLRPKDSFKDCDTCPEMVVIPAGSFVMGSPDNERGRGTDEGPQHKVTFQRPFALGKFEVTFEEWDRCVAANGCKYRPDDRGWGRGRRPVISVSWNEVTKEYLPWLNRVAGRIYRLPTEAEWEYAARAQTTSPYWWGEVISKSQANYRRAAIESGKDKRALTQVGTLPVDSFKPNPWGLYNVHGNAREWVQDCYKDSYLGAPSNGSAVLDVPGCRRGVRSGSWDYGPKDLRSAFRDWDGFNSRDYFVGFRVARTLE